MATQVDICNRALSLVGTRSTIASMTENSNEAQQCAIHYDATLDALLRLHLWSFARRQDSLALLKASATTPENSSGALPVPPDPWLYEYAFPQDCVRVRSIYQPLGGASPIKFSIAADLDAAGNQIKVVLTDQPDAALIYTARITNVNLWDSEFVEAFVNLLAAKLCGPLTGDKTLATMYIQTAQQSVLTARSVDGSETPSNQESIPDWIKARGFAVDSTDLMNTPWFLNSVMGL